MNTFAIRLFGVLVVAILTTNAPATASTTRATVSSFQNPALAQSSTKAATPSQVESSWEKVACPFDASKALLPVTCGRLKVPENYDDPKGRSIEVAVMIVSPERKRDADSPVIFLSGGPGSPSLVHVETLVTTPAIREVVVDRDWVFFDQRGGGRSLPSLFCPPEPDSLKQVKTCRDRLIKEGVDLSQYNSARISSDMEALRMALGVKQWNVWGSFVRCEAGNDFCTLLPREHPNSTCRWPLFARRPGACRGHAWRRGRHKQDL